MKKIDDDIDIKKSINRLKKIASEMNEIVIDIGPKMIKLAHLRNESRDIVECLSKNGLKDQK